MRINRDGKTKTATMITHFILLGEAWTAGLQPITDTGGAWDEDDTRVNSTC